MDRTPEVSGVVLDSITGEPVTIAILTYAEYPDQISHSQQDGTFSLAPVTRVTLTAPFLDQYFSSTLNVSAQGYAPYQEHIHSWDGQVIKKNIVLTPADAHQTVPAEKPAVGSE